MDASFQRKLSENWKSGLTVALVSIPLSISLAVASNTSPVVGIITAIWAGLIASLFGGSNYNIIGPTGALSGMLFLYTKLYGPACLPMLAILSGVFIFIGFLLRFEKYLIFIPGSALHGLILGIAIMIMLTQVNAAFGLPDFPQQAHLIHNVVESFRHITLISWPAFFIFLVTLTGLLLCGRVTERLPGTVLLAPFCILAGYLCSQGMLPWSIQTLGSTFGTIKPVFFQFPRFVFYYSYMVPAFSIASIAIMETMISARIADGMTRTKHNKRRELMGLSLANIGSGLAGGIPATAALARTSLNIKSGGTDKISATICSLSVAAISFLLLSFFQYIPMASIAAILVFVSIRMVEAEHFVRMFRIDRKNFVLSLVVAGVTVYEDPIVGILLGALVAMLLFMERLSKGYHEIVINKTATEAPKTEPQAETTLVYAVKGSLAYINAQSHIARLEETPAVYKNVILDLRNVYFIDLDGVEAFGDMVHVLESKGKRVFVAGFDPMVEQLLNEGTILATLKKNGRVFSTVADAVKTASIS
jgi:SulP family sulfate permease